MDRYAYVSNSPINFTDPNGHVACHSKEECSDLGTTPNGGGSLGSVAELTEKGQLALKTFNGLVKLAKENGVQFGMNDYIRLIFEREIDGFGSIDGIEDLYKEASVRNYWYWASVQFGTHDRITLFNWLGGHNQVVNSLHKDVFINLPAGKKDFSSILGENRDYVANESKANEVVQALLNPPDKWKSFDPNAPYTFGFCDTSPGGLCSGVNPNKYDEFNRLGNSALPLGNFNVELDKMYFKNGISFFVTFNQLNKYWLLP